MLENNLDIFFPKPYERQLLVEEIKYEKHMTLSKPSFRKCHVSELDSAVPAPQRQPELKQGNRFQANKPVFKNNVYLKAGNGKKGELPKS